MDLKKLTNQELIVNTQKLAASERKITHVILLHILEFESRKLYADLGFSSMFLYLTKQLGYGESSAYRRLQSARLLKQIPAVAEKIESGSLNLSQLTQVQKCIKLENSKGEAICAYKTQAILESLENKTTFETEQILAKEFNLPIQKQEVILPQQDESIRMEVCFSKEDYEIIKQAKSLLSHSCLDNTWSNVFVAQAKFILKRKLGAKHKKPESVLVTSQIAKQRLFNKQAQTKKSVQIHNIDAPTQKARSYIPISVKRLVLQKANGCCEFKNHETKQ